MCHNDCGFAQLESFCLSTCSNVTNYVAASFVKLLANGSNNNDLKSYHCALSFLVASLYCIVVHVTRSQSSTSTCIYTLCVTNETKVFIHSLVVTILVAVTAKFFFFFVMCFWPTVLPLILSPVAQFMYIIRRRINLPSEKAMFLFVNKVLPTTRYVCDYDVIRVHVSPTKSYSIIGAGRVASNQTSVAWYFHQSASTSQIHSHGAAFF